MADIEVERRGHAVWITINPPGPRNAYDLAMAKAMTGVSRGGAAASVP
jgi:enoyl-CoA hydratase/carnithine racemase